MFEAVPEIEQNEAEDLLGANRSRALTADERERLLAIQRAADRLMLARRALRCCCVSAVNIYPPPRDARRPAEGGMTSGKGRVSAALRERVSRQPGTAVATACLAKSYGDSDDH
jgi:hypothetical protein